MNKHLLKQTLAFLFFFSLFTSSTRAQDAVAPSLQIGLGGLDFTRGNLDPTIIADIIDKKQGEVKVRLLKNMLLDKVNLSSGTFYTYIDNTINIVTREKDEAIRTKNLMENTVNLAFVCTYVEYYLTTLNKNECDHINALIDDLAGSDPNEEKKKKIEAFKALLCGKKETDELRVAGNYDRFVNSWFNVAFSYSEEEWAKEFKGLIIDMATVAVRSDETLKQMGLMRTNYQTSDNSINHYLSLDVKERQVADPVLEDMKARLNKLTPYIGLINYMNSLSGFSHAQKKTSVETFTDSRSLAEGDLTAKITACKDNLKAIIKDNRWYNEEIKNEIAVVLSFIQKLESIDWSNASSNTLSQLLFQVHNDVLPAVRSISTKAEQFIDIASDLRSIAEGIAKEMIKDFGDNSQLKDDQAALFMKLLGAVWDFDKPATYGTYLDALAEATEIFLDDKTKSAVNTIVNFVRSYTVINTSDPEKPQINVDVESFLVAFKKLPYNRFQPVEFNFTVGFNNAYFKNQVYTESGDTISNFSYFGEKIGVKFKVVDFAYTRSFNKGQNFKYWGLNLTRLAPPREPTISNIHGLAYGSGILYNLINSGTSKNFNHPLIGAGVGITFFNSLDLNASWGFPILRDQSFEQSKTYGFFNVGFDIQFTEYLEELNRRRNEKVEQKVKVKHEEETKVKTKTN